MDQNSTWNPYLSSTAQRVNQHANQYVPSTNSGHPGFVATGANVGIYTRHPGTVNSVISASTIASTPNHDTRSPPIAPPFYSGPADSAHFQGDGLTLIPQPNMHVGQPRPYPALEGLHGMDMSTYDVYSMAYNQQTPTQIIQTPPGSYTPRGHRAPTQTVSVPYGGTAPSIPFSAPQPPVHRSCVQGSVVNSGADITTMPDGRNVPTSAHGIHSPTRSFQRSSRIPEGPPPSSSTSAMSDNGSMEIFTCKWSPRSSDCPGWVTGDKNSVADHLRRCHGFTCDGEVVTCRWGHCNTPLQRRNIARHIVTSHFEVKVSCQHCGMLLSRLDASKKHEKACTGMKPGTQ